MQEFSPRPRAHRIVHLVSVAFNPYSSRARNIIDEQKQLNNDEYALLYSGLRWNGYSADPPPPSPRRSGVLSDFLEHYSYHETVKRFPSGEPTGLWQPCAYHDLDALDEPTLRKLAAASEKRCCLALAAYRDEAFASRFMRELKSEIDTIISKDLARYGGIGKS